MNYLPLLDLAEEICFLKPVVEENMSCEISIQELEFPREELIENVVFVSDFDFNEEETQQAVNAGHACALFIDGMPKMPNKGFRKIDLPFCRTLEVNYLIEKIRSEQKSFREAVAFLFGIKCHKRCREPTFVPCTSQVTTALPTQL